MIKLLEPITLFFFNLDKKKFSYILFSIIALITLLFGMITYIHITSINSLKKEMIKVNNERMQTKNILEQNELLKKQQKDVEELIAQNKQFKLKDYFEKTLEKLNIKNNMKAPTITTEPLELLRSQGYEEVRMEVELVKLNTKQLTELLSELEENKRIDIKKLEITKSKKEPTIDVQLTITTLQKMATATEEFEME